MFLIKDKNMIKFVFNSKPSHVFLENFLKILYFGHSLVGVKYMYFGE